MSEDTRTQQRWLITGVAILVVFLILVLFGVFRSIRDSDDETPHIGYRSPAAELAYCGPQDDRLCVISFGQVEGGDMLVNFQLPRPLYPEFVLVINRFGVESTYTCKRVKSLSTAVICTGVSQAPGEVLQFRVISKADGRLIAEGKFSIIGIAIATPEGLATGTVEGSAPTEPAAFTEVPTDTPAARLPTPTSITPTVSYPNPTLSYPNPTSYP